MSDPISFKQVNCTYAEDQPEYLPLPVHRTADGEVTSCWKLTLLERLKVLTSGKIWVQILTFHSPLQPQKITANNPFLNEKGK